MSRVVICIVRTQAQAEQLVASLRDAALVTSEISLLAPGKPAAAHTDGSADEARSGPVATGSFIGGVLGMLAGTGILAVPGAGPFIAAGPIIAALSATAMGAAIGGVAGGLIWMGLPERVARRLEARIQQGRILVSVDTHGLQDIRSATGIMRESGASDISVACDATTLSPLGGSAAQWV